MPTCRGSGRPRRRHGVTPAALLGAALLAGCQAAGSGPATHTGDEPMNDLPMEEAAMPYDPEDEETAPGKAARVRATHEERLLAIEGVTGVGGEDVIIVYVEDETVAARIPAEIDGVPVEIEVTGEIRALENGPEPL